MKQATRRQFLLTTAAASSMLVSQQSSRWLTAAERASLDQPTRKLTGYPITVITEAVPSDVNPRGKAWIYIREILQRAGMFFDNLAPSEFNTMPPHAKIVVLGGDLHLSQFQRKSLTDFVRDGGSLIGLGGTSGLDSVFGVCEKKPLMEGWVKVTNTEHPVTADLRSSLHVFGGFAVEADSARSLASLDTGRQGAKGSAIVENSFGTGKAMLISPDLIFSVVHIQQGLPVLQDGKPSPDGTAAIDDGELKAEDGLVLDWQRDRTPMEPDKTPVFLEPISDELRTIIVRSILHAAHTQSLSLPVLWYWPRNLPAIGHLSHDTDGHDPNKAVALLDVLNRCNVKTTWCTLYPGGYPREFYEQLKQQGFEIALHYDARTGGAETLWSKDNLILQHRWLKEAAGLEEIVSNKNHYTRWENRLDFLHWCEELGICSDQTRGPSKQGTIGFPLGGSQPYFPLDEVAGRFLNVLEVNLLTQDLVVVCPEEYGRQLLDSALRQHGVAHFLFHPAHIQKPGVADALTNLVDYGRSQGLEWWTSQQVYVWEKLRRGVTASFHSANHVTLYSDSPLAEATLLFLNPSPEPRSIKLNSQAAASESVQVYGFQFDAVTTDLAGTADIHIG